MSVTVLVVEDEPAIQDLIEVNLQSAGYRVVRAYSAEAALPLADEMSPNLILVDWMLPGQNGVSLVRRLRAMEKSRTVPIIMLTARSEEQDRILGLESGADDYMTKPFSPREMLARIDAIFRRCAPVAINGTLELGGLQLNPSTQRVTASNRALSLGPIEFRLLHFFLKFPERVHSRTHLLDQVWGSSAFIEERTVDTHVGRLRNSLEATGHHVLIETVRGSGYRMALAAGNAHPVKQPAGEREAKHA